MIKTLLKENETLRELMLGILVFGILAEIVIMVISSRTAYNSLGLLCGILVSEFMAFHMAYTIEISILLPEKGAIAYMRKMMIIRYVVVCIVLGVIGVTNIANPITVIVGIFGLKMGAYMQPLTHKLISKRKRGE